MGSIHAAPPPAGVLWGVEHSNTRDALALGTAFGPGGGDERQAVTAIEGEFDHDVRGAIGMGPVMDLFPT